MQFLKIVLNLWLICSLIACGGGGGGSGTRLSSVPIAPQGSSYLNFKNLNLSPQSIPEGVAGNGTTARAYGDFSRSGNIDLITATLTYKPSLPIGSATPSALRYWKAMSNGTYVEDSSKLSSSAGCIHPRKALVADFNSDGTPDVFLTCHGYDAGNYPGEKNKIILSQANGIFLVADASSDIDFWHGATALDVNSDGAIDVIAVTGGNNIKTFINDRSGHFSIEKAGRFPTFKNGGYYSIEAADIDDNGLKDILIGGHEADGAITSILINPGVYNFGTVAPNSLPSVAGQGVVLDFVVTGGGANALIWILRTGDGNNFYVGKSIQKVTYQTKATATVLQDNTGTWVPWIIPTLISGTGYISSDISAHNFKVGY